MYQNLYFIIASSILDQSIKILAVSQEVASNQINSIQSIDQHNTSIQKHYTNNQKQGKHLNSNDKACMFFFVIYKYIMATRNCLKLKCLKFFLASSFIKQPTRILTTNLEELPNQFNGAHLLDKLNMNMQENNATNQKQGNELTPNNNPGILFFCNIFI